MLADDDLDMVTKKINGKSFQTMSMSRWLLKAILRKGYKVPTPIQQKCIPPILQGKDVVGMSRTGSGKTGAFVIPILEKLKCHSAQMGARALILAPNRELALQILTYAKELCRKGRDVAENTGSSIRLCALMGGDAMEDQFSALAENPDLIVATPGRFLHVLMETGLDLMSIQHVVFDEADRLFEMGFEEQLREILHKLPKHRQTLLFSATLPRTLVDFAKAGLSNPLLIRLDTESKLSPDLQLSFFTVKPGSKEAALLYLINQKVVDIRTQSTIVFTSTRHHVDYLKELFDFMNIPCTQIHGQLDQEARRINLQSFRSGRYRIMLVTDVAARGIDIPLLDNVIHYDFPCKVKLFIHRCGRVARAGRPGKSFALVTSDELPFVLDLQLFLSKPLIVIRPNSTESLKYDSADYQKLAVDKIIVGEMPQSLLDEHEMESVKQALLQSATLENLKRVTGNAWKLYVRTRGSASQESFKRAKEITDSIVGTHPCFSKGENAMELERLRILGSIKTFKPPETIFEVSKKTHLDLANVTMQRLRSKADARIDRFRSLKEVSMSKKDESATKDTRTLEMADESLIKQQAESAVTDFTASNDDPTNGQKKWDKKRKKYVTVGQVGRDNKKRIKTESGASLPASYKTDAYSKWVKKNKLSLPRTGEQELSSDKVKPIASGIRWKQKFRHTGGTPAAVPKTPKATSKAHKNELKSKDQILKNRKIIAKRREKNARPSKKRST